MRMPRLLEVNMIKQLIPAKCMRIGFLRYQAVYQFLVQKSYSTIEAHSQQQEVVIAIGSNVGDRLNNSRRLRKIWAELSSKQMSEMEGKQLAFVDTFYFEVAREVVKKGVHLVNDASGEI
ncbi:hypothetical protein SAY86_008093 [Trapa natans]|uniref:Uncharacterized protein n=1 Tax=Trapa natans TaxID=22666 RepID=A0AAN7KGJ4_TRANT|nr:hypothetical protein SAY86_008093 [Trapa natans]